MSHIRFRPVTQKEISFSFDKINKFRIPFQMTAFVLFGLFYFKPD